MQKYIKQVLLLIHFSNFLVPLYNPENLQVIGVIQLKSTYIFLGENNHLCNSCSHLIRNVEKLQILLHAMSITYFYVTPLYRTIINIPDRLHVDSIGLFNQNNKEYLQDIFQSYSSISIEIENTSDVIYSINFS